MSIMKNDEQTMSDAMLNAVHFVSVRIKDAVYAITV